ncbi:hypothetical protein [Rhizobium sp. BK602]|uniref:hypothetical protein n=1 Tax=Rhizobium sp. BK602 TaxID=2586986 RepID=UPI00160AC8CD|nr:hypothetical protein [Rhizobium sp. BK602]MBB3608621.1 hypothetical protein [Rhizobium sp. BK602]
MLKVDKPSNRTTLRCDSCQTTFARDDEPFDIAATIQSAKAVRWSIERHAGAWQHFCPACAKSRTRGKLL